MINSTELTFGWDLPATPRHTSQSLPLLPSGPGGIRDVSLRGDQQVPITKWARIIPNLSSIENPSAKRNICILFKQIALILVGLFSNKTAQAYTNWDEMDEKSFIVIDNLSFTWQIKAIQIAAND